MGCPIKYAAKIMFISFFAFAAVQKLYLPEKTIKDQGDILLKQFISLSTRHQFEFVNELNLKQYLPLLPQFVKYFAYAELVAAGSILLNINSLVFVLIFSSFARIVLQVSTWKETDLKKMLPYIVPLAFELILLGAAMSICCQSCSKSSCCGAAKKKEEKKKDQQKPIKSDKKRN